MLSSGNNSLASPSRPFKPNTSLLEWIIFKRVYLGNFLFPCHKCEHTWTGLSSFTLGYSFPLHRGLVFQRHHSLFVIRRNISCISIWDPWTETRLNNLQYIIDTKASCAVKSEESWGWEKSGVRTRFKHACVYPLSTLEHFKRSGSRQSPVTISCDNKKAFGFLKMLQCDQRNFRRNFDPGSKQKKQNIP